MLRSKGSYCHQLIHVIFPVNIFFWAKLYCCEQLDLSWLKAIVIYHQIWSFCPLFMIVCHLVIFLQNLVLLCACGICLLSLSDFPNKACKSICHKLTDCWCLMWCFLMYNNVNYLEGHFKCSMHMGMIALFHSCQCQLKYFKLSSYVNGWTWPHFVHFKIQITNLQLYCCWMSSLAFLLMSWV